VEAVLTLPVVLIGLLLIVQVGVVVRDALALGLAAREGARQAAINDDDSMVYEAIRRSAGPLDASAIGVAISPARDDRRRGEPVTVSLTYEERIRIPVVDRIVDTDMPLRSSVTMRLERTTATPTPSPTPAPTATPTPAPTATPTPAPP
jgi:hypothetical protein